MGSPTTPRWKPKLAQRSSPPYIPTECEIRLVSFRAVDMGRQTAWGWRLTRIKYNNIFSFLSWVCQRAGFYELHCLEADVHLSGWGLLHAIIFLPKSSGGGLEKGLMKKTPCINHQGKETWKSGLAVQVHISRLRYALFISFQHRKVLRIDGCCGNNLGLLY